MDYCQINAKTYSHRAIVHLLEQWFISGSTCVKWGLFVSDFFDLRYGVRQGGVLSPYLFAVYIDNVLSVLVTLA